MYWLRPLAIRCISDGKRSFFVFEKNIEKKSIELLTRIIIIVKMIM